MTRSIAIGFVIYNPEESFLDRVKSTIQLGFNVYIFDNSPENRIIWHFASQEPKVRYMTCGKNHGLGLGISTVCAQAYYANNVALLFFDQDSIFSEETLNFIDKFYLKNAAMEKTHSAIVFNSKKLSSDQNIGFLKDVPLVINSGSLFFLKNLKKLNWHNESYFVDGVDYDFCLRSSLNGFLIGEYDCTPGFDHSTEQPDQHYIIFGKEYALRAYSYTRIIDTSTSSLKLIIASLMGGAIKFTFKIVRLWLIYLIAQILVRILKTPKNNTKESPHD